MPQPVHAVDIQLAFDKWATDQLLDACKPLDEAALDQTFDIGPGSLRKLIAHLIDVVGGWHAGLAGHDYTPAAPNADIVTLTALHGQTHDAFATFVRAASADDIWMAVKGARRLTAPRDVFVSHVLTHQMHHRAQALNMLKHLGVTPLPQSSVMQWMLATGAGQMQIGSAPAAPQH